MAVSPSTEGIDQRGRARRARTAAAAGLLLLWTVLVGVAWGAGAAFGLLALVAGVLGAKVGRERNGHTIARARASELSARARARVATTTGRLSDAEGPSVLRGDVVRGARRIAGAAVGQAARGARRGGVASARLLQGVWAHRRDVAQKAGGAMVPAVAIGALLVAAAAVAYGETRLRSEQSARQRDVSAASGDLRRLRSEVASLDRRNQALSRRVGALARRTSVSAVGRVVPSVVTVQAPAGDASGWIAWTTPDHAFVVTASTAVAGRAEIDLRTARGVTKGEVVDSDPTTGLALVRVDGEVSRGLWQRDRAPSRAPYARRAFVVASPHDAPGHVLEVVVTPSGSIGPGTRVDDVDGLQGAPVVDAGGVVVGTITTTPDGGSLVVPVTRLCERLRRC